MKFNKLQLEVESAEKMSLLSIVIITCVLLFLADTGFGAEEIELSDAACSVQKSVQLYGAAADGMADDSDAVMDAIADAANRDSYVIFTEGIYLIGKSITFNVPVFLEHGAVLKPNGKVTIDTDGRIMISADDRSTHFDFSNGGKIINLNMARPEWFGGKPNSSDTRSAFEDAEASLSVNGELRLDKGSYVFDGNPGPIVTKKSLKIRGVGTNSSMVTITGAKSNFWQFLFVSRKHESAPGFEVTDMSFKCKDLTTSGYVIDVENVSGVHQGTDSLIKNIVFARFGKRIYGGIRIGPGSQHVNIQNIQGASMENFLLFQNAFNCTVSNFKGGGGDRKSSVGIRLVGSSISTGGSGTDTTVKVIDHAGSEAVDFTDGMLVNFGIALKVEGDEAERFKNVAACKFQRIYFDDSKYTHNLHLSKMTNSWFSECYIVSAERYGAFLEDCHTLHFLNCQFDNNAYRGVHVNKECTGIFFNGGSAADNGWAMDDNGAGIWIESGVKEFQIMGMDCRGDRGLDKGGYYKAQGTGIHIGEDCDQFIVTSNIVTGNRNNIENKAGISTTRIVNNNISPQ
jgi:hypothetical protein